MSTRYPKIKALPKLKTLLVAGSVLTLPLASFLHAQGWHKQESENFIVIYLESHAHLTPQILSSAENVLARLRRVFHYVPTEKIVINTHDFSDYGAAGATTVPHNFIRLEIEPLELGYENIPFNERLQWLIGHELVHIVVNDLASRTESVARALFSKVPPEQDQPLSIFYSLLTNYSRYTPRWHQEGIAVFMETWLSGGYGRILGNFDEMYFRSLVLEGKPFPNFYELETQARHSSFLLTILDYLYGARFIAFLGANFGTDKLMQWYRTHPGEFYSGFDRRFKNVFDTDLSTAWKLFVRLEKKFQRKNITTLKSAPLTPITRVRKKPVGWVTQPYLDASGFKILFGHHEPHELTTIELFDLKNDYITKIGSLPTPSIIGIASTAYDKHLRQLFYTTNNNQLYRDIRVFNVASRKDKILFKNCRVGDLSTSAKTHELWGVRHSGGKAALVYSKLPYEELETLVAFQFGNILQHLAVSPSGRFLAGVLHQAAGIQAIVVAEIGQIKRSGRFNFRVISEEGSPEHPAWSADESYLYWNAYTNGVSNIYRCHRDSNKVEAMSHTLRGLFRPQYLNENLIFAFEFTSDGFIPVIIPNTPAERLPAINYYGQKIVSRTPQVTGLALTHGKGNNHQTTPVTVSKRYSGLSKVQFHSFIPVISGFREQKVVGFYTHLADPLFTHDFIFEFGISPFTKNDSKPKLHFKGNYEFKRKFKLTIEHNAPDFYDLFNDRKVGMKGTRYAIENTHYWKFDLPHKIKQSSELALYTGIEAINDNLITVSNPDFFVFESNLNSRNIRRAIGSVDSESGYEWTITLMGLGADLENPQLVGGLHIQWSRFLKWLVPHNIFHLSLASGYLRTRTGLSLGRFYFGGFGNRNVENKEVKQYRTVFRFPGAPIYSLSTGRFAKVMIENSLPPLRLSKVHLGKHLLSHIDLSLFSQGLIIDSRFENKWVNIGAQINLVFSHWFNLESTLSAGMARAWSQANSSQEWFISFKLLTN